MSNLIPRTILIFLLFAASAPAQTGDHLDVPSPRDVLGFDAGADFKLADWDMMERYFHELDAASDRVLLETIGQSSLGRRILLVVISSEENIRNADKIRDALARLADPRGLSNEEREQLIEKTPAALFVGCSQHSTEIGATQASLSLAFRLASAKSGEIPEILKHTVLLLVPCLNPDGHQMVCDWYNEHLGTPFEGSRMPWLYHAYVGHDINRDWAMNSQAETRAVSRVLYETWHPQVVVDVHQMGNRGARIFIPPYYDPINPNIAPLIQHQLALLCAQARLDLSAAGLKGVITNALFDEWLLGYLTSVPTRHNMTAILIEMASANLASPLFQRQRDLRDAAGREQEYGPLANFPEPWEGGWWRLGDIVRYEETTLLSLLGVAARDRAGFLRRFARLGEDQVRRGTEEPPFAFLIPAEQRDPATAWKMLEALMRGGVEVHRARAEFEADGVLHPAGTWAVLMTQPYRAHAKDLLELQTYPNLRAYPGGPPERPYDVAGWTLPLLMGVRCFEAVEPFQADLERIEPVAGFPAGRLEGLEAASRYAAIGRSQNNAFLLANRRLSDGEEVFTLPAAAEQEGCSLEAGCFIIPLGEDPEEAMKEIAALGLKGHALNEAPQSMAAVPRVRLGLYRPWTASMDEGWTRWVLEQFEFPFRSLYDAEIRAGNLRDRYDAIILPDLYPSSIIEGVEEGSLPARYTGGIGEAGVFALRDFVRDGGTLIAMDSSCDFAIEKLGLPVQNILKEDYRARGRYEPAGALPDEGEKKRFFCPGSLLRIELEGHYLAFGVGSSAAVLHVNSPVFDRIEEKEKHKSEEKKLHSESESPAKASLVVVGRYPGMNPLMSGWLENDELIHEKWALVWAPFGEGAAVLIGFAPQFRAQAHGTFKILFNAVLGAPEK